MSQYDKRDAREGVGEIARVSLLVSVLSIVACVMGLSLSLTYGATAAKIAVANAAVSLTNADIAGRWSGSYHGSGALRSKCEGGPCKLTLDISKCEGNWCGVIVNADGSCGARAMNLTAGVAPATDYLQYEGRLELEPKAASYVIQATLWVTQAGERSVDIVGDSGKELMLMRRSFPFSAHIARTGEAVCSGDKSTT